MITRWFKLEKRSGLGESDAWAAMHAGHATIADDSLADLHTRARVHRRGQGHRAIEVRSPKMPRK